MHDRIPLYPGRVKLTPVSGVQDTYDMVRADQPQQEGTPLNKSTLLTDEVAREYGLGDNATPNDIFRATSILFNGLGNQYLWEKRTKEVITDELVDMGDSLTIDGIMAMSLTFYTSDTYSTKVGELSPVTHEQAFGFDMSGWDTVQITFGQDPYAKFKKYFVWSGGVNNVNKAGVTKVIYTKNENSSYSTYTGAAATNYMKLTDVSGLKAVRTVVPSEHVTYVNSPDIDAYPADDGYDYIYLGQLASLGGHHGSYKGTGTYGSNNQNTLSFDFPVNCVTISYDGVAGVGTLIRGTTTTPNLYVVWGDTSVSWYSTNNASNQYNSAGTTYNYMAW